MEILLSVGIIIAAALGFLIGQKNSSSMTEKNRLEQALKEKSAELEAFHSKVNTHFEKTSELFNQVSDSYQSLYDHMAKSSTQLCASQTFQSLPKTSEDQNETPHDSTVTQGLSNSQTSRDLFDADHLYQAHEYRNHPESDLTEEEQIAMDNKVVEIITAKEEIDEQALDYAIKEKGVINHNSLNIEGVKNS